MINDPHNAGSKIRLDPPGFWYSYDPQAAKKYQMMIPHTLRLRHIQDIVTRDGLLQEQIVNRVGEGFNLSSAVIDTLDSTTMTMLPSASGYRMLRPAGLKPASQLGLQSNTADNGAGRGLKRGAPNG